MNLLKILLVFFAVDLVQVVSGQSLTLQLSSVPSSVGVGQPIVIELNYHNDSSQQVVLSDSANFVRVAISPSLETVSKPHLSSMLTEGTTFLTPLKAHEKCSVDYAVEEVTRIAVPGMYTIRVEVPSLSLSSSFSLLVTPSTGEELTTWAYNAADRIQREPNVGTAMAWTKALIAMPSEMSLPSLCILIKKHTPSAVPLVVNRLHEIGSLASTRCLIAALAEHVDGVERDYLLSTIRQINARTKDVEVRKLTERHLVRLNN